MKITVGLLKKVRACDSQVELFEKVFPKGCNITERNTLKALQKGLQVDWLIQFVPYEYKKAYQEATATAEKAYQEAKATAWKAYQEAKAPAEKAYQEAKATAEKAYQEAKAPAEKAYQEATATAEKAYQEAKAPALTEALLHMKLP